MGLRKDMFDHAIKEAYQIGSMIEQEGESAANARYKVIVAENLIMIADALRTIRHVLIALAGFVVGKFLSGLF